MTACLCPAMLGHLGRHAWGVVWRQDGDLHVSPPYVTGNGPPTPWGGFPPLPCSPEHGLAYLVGAALRAEARQ